VRAEIAGLPAVLALESLALLAFAASWFVKAELVLGDLPREIPRERGGPRMFEDSARLATR
jgi:hypothetical protein